MAQRRDRGRGRLDSLQRPLVRADAGLRRRAGEGLDFQGVYRIPPEGGDPQLLADDFEQPNGLCFSPDESLLYINDTPRAHIRVFDVRSDGTIASG